MGLFDSIGKANNDFLRITSGGLIGGYDSPQAQGYAVNDKAFTDEELKKKQEETKKKAEAAGKRQEKQVNAAQINQGQQAQFRQGQQDLVSQLKQQLTGQAPSLANAQLKAATDRNLAQQLALARSTGSTNPAAVQRALLQQQAATGQEAAQQSAALRLQEQTQAQQLLGQALGQGREQDIGLAQQQAALQQQASLANQQAALQQQQLNDQLTQYYEQQGFTRDQAAQQALQDLERLKVQQATGIATANLEASTAAQKAKSGILGSVIGGAASIFSKSDRTQKTNISDAKKSVKQFLNALKAKEFEYKDLNVPNTTPGRQMGVIAQDIEKGGKLGKSLIVDDNGSKSIDMRKGFGALLASAADLNGRLNSIEKALKLNKNKKGK